MVKNELCMNIPGHLCTNIPGNDTQIEFWIPDVYTEDGIAENLRNVVINLCIETKILEHYIGDNYHKKR